MKIWLRNIFLLVLAASCSPKIKPEEKQVSPAASVIYKSNYIPKTEANFTIDSLGIKDDILSLKVIYSGGCKEHSFELITKEKPDLASGRKKLYLNHVDGGDNCRQIIEARLNFDISSLRSGKQNMVILELEDKTIDYRYP